MKYYTSDLLDKIEEDAEKIKETNKDLSLSFIKDELARFFGHQNYKEIKNNEKNLIRNISGDIKYLEHFEAKALIKMKNKYKEKVFKLSKNKNINHTLFRNIAPLSSYILNKNKKEKIKINLTEPVYLKLSNKDFEYYMEVLLRSEHNVTHDKVFHSHVMKFNRVMFKLCKYLKIDNYQKYYEDNKGLDCFLKQLRENPNFHCLELSEFLENSDFKRNDIPTEEQIDHHKYITMYLNNKIDIRFHTNDNENNKKAIKISEIRDKKIELLFCGKNNSFSGFYEFLYGLEFVLL